MYYSYIFGRAQSYTVTFRLLAITDTPVIWTVTANSMVNVKKRDVCIYIFFGRDKRLINSLCRPLW